MSCPRVPCGVTRWNSENYESMYERCCTVSHACGVKCGVNCGVVEWMKIKIMCFKGVVYEARQME